LLNETLKHFESGWRTTYQLSRGGAADRAAGTGPVQEARRSSGLNASESPAISFEPPNPAKHPASHGREPVPAPTMGLPLGRPVRIASGAAEGLLVRKVPPTYPLDAKLVRLEGTVVVKAVIDRSGGVSEVSALSGPPLLASAAVDAVKQWQYRPYAVNGQPVEVETTIEVVFALDGSHSGSRAQSARR
jgi:TonB family protein